MPSGRNKDALEYDYCEVVGDMLDIFVLITLGEAEADVCLSSERGADVVVDSRGE